MSVHNNTRREARRGLSRRNLLAKAASIDWTGSRYPSPQRAESSGTAPHGERSLTPVSGANQTTTTSTSQMSSAPSPGTVATTFVLRGVHGETERQRALNHHSTAYRRSSMSPSPPSHHRARSCSRPPAIPLEDNQPVPMPRPKQPLRKTLSDNSAVSARREDLTLEDLTGEVGETSKRQPGAERISKNMVIHQDSCSSSCPNLVQGEISRSNAAGASQMESADRIREQILERPLSSCNENLHGSQEKLIVPDIFVTSFTHSVAPLRRPAISGRQESLDSVASDSEVDDGSGIRRTPIVSGTGRSGPHSRYRHSAPELSCSPTSTHSSTYWVRLRESLRTNLTRALSEGPALPSKPNLANTDEHICPQCNNENCDQACVAEKLPILKRRVGVREPRVAKLLSYLYIGNLETAYNERLTCQLGIRSVIDLSNMTPEEVPGARRNPAPCICIHQERHLKATLRLGLAGTDLAEMQASFQQINKFIEGARKVEKKVLVVCSTGNSHSALAVMQYLMVHRGCNLRKAYSMVMRQGADIHLSAGQQTLLLTLERRLVPTGGELTEAFDNRLRCDSLGVPCQTLTREAWTTSESEI